MASVTAHGLDLLFGSKVMGMLAAAGHELTIAGSADAVGEQIAGSDVLLVDLCENAADRIALVGALHADGALEGTRTLAFYLHTDVETRTQALAAGFDLVVPRSRMNREGPALVDGLVSR